MDEQPVAPEQSTGGAEDVWANIDRAYDTEYKHHKRMTKLHQQAATLSAQTFQSQMLGLLLLGESEQALQQAAAEAPQPDPTQRQ